MSILGKFLCYPRVSPIARGFSLCVSIHHDSDLSHLKAARDAGFSYAGVDSLDGFGNADQVEAAVMSACNAAGLLTLGQQGPQGRLWKQATMHVTVNEPNSSRFWTAGPEALVARYREIRKTDPSRLVIGGNLTWLSSTNPQQWIKDLWRLGANECMDFIGIHAYEGAGKETIAQYDEIARCYREAGFKQPFWCSEFGFRNDRWPESEEKQARWTSYVLSKLSRKTDCVGANVYQLSGNDGFSMIRANGRVLPVMERIREAKA